MSRHRRPARIPRTLRRLATLVVVASLVVPAAACGEELARQSGDRMAHNVRSAATLETQRFPALLNVRPVKTAPRTYDFMVMVSSPYDSPGRYADGWRVLTLAGDVIAVKRLARPHPDEQPFWRRHSNVRVPRGVRKVLFEGHDSRNGYGGERLRVTLP